MIYIKSKSLILSFMLIATSFVGKISAETFEFLNYNSPPGWTKQELPEKTTYQRKSGIGAIAFYTSYQINGSTSDEFAKMWRMRFESVLSVKAPQPEIQREGDLTAAVGGQWVDAQGNLTTAVMTVFVGRGKAICVLSLSAGDDVLREVTAFFDSIKVLPESSAAQSNSGSATSGKIKPDSSNYLEGYTADEPKFGNTSSTDGNTTTTLTYTINVRWMLRRLPLR